MANTGKVRGVEQAAVHVQNRSRRADLVGEWQEANGGGRLGEKAEQQAADTMVVPTASKVWGSPPGTGLQPILRRPSSSTWLKITCFRRSAHTYLIPPTTISARATVDRDCYYRRIRGRRTDLGGPLPGRNRDQQAGGWGNATRRRSAGLDDEIFPETQTIARIAAS